MPKRPNDYLIVRETELKRVKRFLTNPNGGSLLVGGYRGSGKSTLVNQSINQIQNDVPLEAGTLKSILLKLRSFTKAEVIKVNIPLIIVDSEKDSDGLADVYRSLLMRSMVIGLEADMLRRYEKHYPEIDLPLRWFRSIGYVQRYRSLKQYSHYLSLNKSTTKVLSAASHIGGAKLQGAVSAEIDLSVSSLEIKLRDLLSQYSKIHKFIFVFDELDKLPEKIVLEKVVLYMKNLFTETGAYAIFITDEKSFNRIYDKSRQDPPTELTTLFVDHIQLDYMTRQEFADLIQQRVTGIPNEALEALVSTMTLHTKRSPNELRKLFIKDGYDYESLRHGLNIELGEDAFNRYSTMQFYTDFVMQHFGDRYDNDFRRLLNDALTEAGTILLARDSAYVSYFDAMTLFYTTDMFAEAEYSRERTLEIEREFKRDGDSKAVDEPSVVTRISALYEERSDTVLRAIEMLITLLNRTGMLSLTIHPGGHVFTISAINGLKFKHDDIDPDKFKEALELSEQEAHLLELYTKLNNAYLGITGKELLELTPVVRSPDRDDVDNVFGKYSFSNVKPIWNEIRSLTKKHREIVLKAIADKIKESSPTVDVAPHKGNSLILVTTSGERFEINVLFGGQRHKFNSTFEKTFVFRDPSVLHPVRKTVSPKLRHFSMKPQWSNFKRAVAEIANWINIHSS